MIADYIVDIINQVESRSGRRPTKIVCNAATLHYIKLMHLTHIKYDYLDTTCTYSVMGIPIEVDHDVEDNLIYVLGDGYCVRTPQRLITEAFIKHNDAIDAFAYSYSCLADALSPPALYDDPISDDELDAILNGGGFRATK